MNRFLFLLSFLAINILSYCQKKFNCAYIDTITSVFPDSLYKKSFREQNSQIPNEVLEQLIDKLKAMPAVLYQTRFVRASEDKTIIHIDRTSKEGNLSYELYDSLLFKKGQFFNEAETPSGFSDTAISFPPRIFMETGNQTVISGYICSEYTSIDSTCRIWITKALPSYINPGVQTGEVNGAVLAFELKLGLITTRSRLKKLELFY